MTSTGKISYSDSDPPMVQIVVLNYKGVNDTIELLKNLRYLRYPNFNVIIIDNNSDDDSEEKLKYIENDYPGWKFIYNTENFGFSGGCNQGIRIALEQSADFVLLLNNDTEVNTDFLDKLVELSLRHNCLAGGIIYHHHDRDLIWSYGGNLTWGAVPGHLNLYCRKDDRHYLEKNMVTDWIPGCCLLIPSEIFVKIGLLDEDYFAYVEDVDFCLRAFKAGYKCRVTTESLIFHKVGQSTGGGYSARGRELIAESSVIFTRKHGDSSKQVKFFFLFWIGIMVAFIREGLRGNAEAVRKKISGHESGWRKKLNKPPELTDFK